MPAGDIEIVYPQEGTIIYAEALFVSGTMTGQAEQALRIEVVDVADVVLAQADVDTSGGNWQVEILHGYTGEPVEAALRVSPRNGADLYDTANFVLSSDRYRPEGVFGQITQPGAGDSVGGDAILVEGSVSGVFENQFQVALFAADGTVLDEELVIVMNPYFIDEVPYRAELQPGDYLGAAEIRAFIFSPADGSERSLGGVRVIIDTSAG